MKAAALGHQYLTVKSQNKQDSYYLSGRSRFERRRLLIEPQVNPFYEEDNAQPTTSTEPLARRSPAIIEESNGNTPAVAIIGRSVSEPHDPFVIYQSEPLIRPVAKLPEDSKFCSISFLRLIFHLQNRHLSLWLRS